MQLISPSWVKPLYKIPQLPWGPNWRHWIMYYQNWLYNDIFMGTAAACEWRGNGISCQDLISLSVAVNNTLLPWRPWWDAVTLLFPLREWHRKERKSWKVCLIILCTVIVQPKSTGLCSRPRDAEVFQPVSLLLEQWGTLKTWGELPLPIYWSHLLPGMKPQYQVCYFLLRES